jgi:hypothetical protein
MDFCVNWMCQVHRKSLQQYRHETMSLNTAIIML